MTQYFPPLGTVLPLGVHPVQCQTMSDVQYVNSMIMVHVEDTTPPEIPGAVDRTVQAAGPAGTVIPDLFVTALDIADPLPNLVVTAPPGNLFPIGDTLVECFVTDASGNTNSVEFVVTVVDTTAPQIFCPPSMTLLKNTAEGADLEYPLVVFDAGDPDLMVECSAPSGSILPLGLTTVVCTVTDAYGNQSTCSFQVQVNQPDAGLISGLNASGGNVSMTFPTQPGVEYAVEYKDSLDDAEWQPLEFVVGTGSPMQITDPAPAQLMRYYRVRSP
jgi:hypothetical protein